VKTILVVTVLMLSGLSGAVAQGPKCPEEVKYDRFRDQTTEVCSALVLETPTLGLFGITPNISYAGTKRAAPIKISFVIVSQRGAVGHMLSPEYSDGDVLYLLTDRGRSEIPVKVVVPTGPKRDMIIEALITELTPAALRILVDASEAEGRIGAKEFHFDEFSLRSFQKALREIEPLLNLPKAHLTTRPGKTKQ